MYLFEGERKGEYTLFHLIHLWVRFGGFGCLFFQSDSQFLFFW